MRLLSLPERMLKRVMPACCLLSDQEGMPDLRQTVQKATPNRRALRKPQFLQNLKTLKFRRSVPPKKQVDLDPVLFCGELGCMPNTTNTNP